MRQGRFSEEQIIGILKQNEAGNEAGAAVTQLCRDHGIGESTFYKWKSKYGGLEVSEARRLRALEEENSKLKRLLAESMLDVAALKDVLSKNGEARCQTRSDRSSASSTSFFSAAGLYSGRNTNLQLALSQPSSR